MITPSLDSNPSISTRSWLSVCSRSSLPPPYPAPRCRPTASISSMKTIQGAFFLACSNMSRTRLAPTPTNISTKSNPGMVKTPRQQRLTGARRANQKRALGDLAAKTAELLRIAQEFDDLFEFLLGLIDAGDIVKRDAAMLFGQHLGLGLAKAHRATLAAALHPVHEINPYVDQQDEWQKRDQECLEARLFLRLGVDRDIGLDQHVGQFGILGLDGNVFLAIRAAKAHVFAIQRNLTYIAILNRRDELGILDRLALERVPRATEQIEQCQYQQEQNQPEGDISCVAQGNSP